VLEMTERAKKLRRAAKSPPRPHLNPPLPDSKITPPPRPPIAPATPAYIGFVERIGPGVIEGWALDRLDLSRHPGVRAMADGQIIGTGVSDIYREHVYNSGAGDGRYGFRITFEDSATPLERIMVVIDDAAHPFRLPLTQQAMAAARASNPPARIGPAEEVKPGPLQPARGAGLSPAIAPEDKIAPAPSEGAMAALEARVQTLQAELARFKSALGQSIEKLVRHSAEAAALGPLTEELRDASPVPPEQLPWEARAIYQQLLEKLSAQA